MDLFFDFLSLALPHETIIKAIILFSGLGSIEDAQETLSVGVGALAGSTIMLLTIPWAVSVLAGRVDLSPTNGLPNYMGKPKLSIKESWRDDLFQSGVALTEAVRHGGIVMALTTIPYFLIQVPASFLHGPSQEVAKGEHWWALLGLIICLSGLLYYMRLQLYFSREGQDRDHRIAVIKKVLHKGTISLSGALAQAIQSEEKGHSVTEGGEYGSLKNDTDQVRSSFYTPPAKVAAYLKEILFDAFAAYDYDRSHRLEKKEIRIFFKDFHENISEDEMDRLFGLADTNSDGSISFEEFIALAYNLIYSRHQLTTVPEETEGRQSMVPGAPQREIIDNIWKEEKEEEEVPEEFTDLSPEAQQKAIKWRAFKMLALGTVMVIYFSDPMVEVMQEIANRAGLSPFYVSFVLAPLASNASEVLASRYYAAKKTRKTMTVSLSALEGAASMNNTFWYDFDRF